MPSTGSRQTTGRARWTIALAILLVAIIGVAMSMTLPLLSLRLDQAGWSGGMIGLNTSFMALATLSLAPFIPSFAKKFGIRALLVTALVTGATATLGFGWAHSVWIWFALRFMLGCSLTVLFILSEFWINAASPDDRRGLIMGIYGTILSLGFASGPLVLQQTGTEGEWPLILGAGIFVLALVPVWMAGRQTPQMDGHAGLGFASLFRSAPVAALAALLFGAVETGAFSVLPVYGHRIGLDDRAAAMQISAVALGNLFFQIPFGLLADRVDKRRLLLLIAGLAGLVTLVIPFLSPLSWLYLGTLCLWGGVAASLYCVGLAMLGAQFHRASLVAANALFVMLYATGQMFGPPLLGWAMDMVNPHGYIWASASLFGLYIAIVLGFGRPKSG